MKVAKFILFFSTFLIVSIAYSDGFECFQCNSYKDKDCDAAQPPAHYLKPCNISVTKGICFQNTTGLDIDTTCQEVRSQCQPTPFRNCNNVTNVTQCQPTPFTPCDDVTLAQEIPVTTFICRKSVTSVYGTFVSERGDTKVERRQTKPRVARDCGYIFSRTEAAGCFRRGNGGSSQVSCLCRKSGCNHAELQTSLQRFLLFMLLLILEFVWTVLSYNL